MPTIKLTDRLGLDVDAQPAPASALLKYFRGAAGTGGGDGRDVTMFLGPSDKWKRLVRPGPPGPPGPPSRPAVP
jgi:hypothetical protein